MPYVYVCVRMLGETTHIHVCMYISIYHTLAMAVTFRKFVCSTSLISFQLIKIVGDISSSLYLCIFCFAYFQLRSNYTGRFKSAVKCMHTYI